MNFIIRNKTVWSVLTGVLAFLFALLMVGTFFAVSYASMINKELGVSSSIVVKDENSNEDTNYYKSKFANNDELTKWQVELCEQIQGEGSVLVENNGALPADKGTSVTCFGRSSADIIYGGTGSGQVDTANAATMKKALIDAGFKVNEAMLDWYSGKVADLKTAKTDRSAALRECGPNTRTWARRRA